MGLKSGGTGVAKEEFPRGWQLSSLNDFWSVTDCKHVTAEFLKEGIPVASIGEVQSRFVNLRNAKLTSEYFYKLLTEGGRKPEAGDLIISRNATVGSIAQVPTNAPDFAMGQDVCLLRKRNMEYSTDYLQQIFSSSLIGSQFADAMVGSTFKRMVDSSC